MKPTGKRKVTGYRRKVYEEVGEVELKRLRRLRRLSGLSGLPKLNYLNYLNLLNQKKAPSRRSEKGLLLL